MTWGHEITWRFVDSMPDRLEDDTLYISLEYATMMHLCACGCGREVVTPLSPRDWRFTFDGEVVSVLPSVGSWDLPCRSHYIIRKNRIRWARGWSEERIAEKRARERAVKAAHYGEGPPPEPAQVARAAPPSRTWTQRVIHSVRDKISF